MLRFLIIFFLTVFISSAAYALEADQYWLWKTDMQQKDASLEINTWINRNLDIFLDKKINSNDKKFECSELPVKYFRYLRPNILFNRMKRDLLKTGKLDVFPKEKKMFENYNKSIYRGFIWPFNMPVAQTVYIDGVYFGTDKLDHFFSSGRRYTKVYNKARKKGLSHQEALIKAIEFGLNTIEERGVLGFWSSGAWSYADLESNYQGLNFALDFCQGKKPMVQNVDGKWQRVRAFDIRDYINPLWDEAFNNSFYAKPRFRGVSKVLKKEYCEMAKLPKVRKLWRSYHKRLKPHFQTLYLRGLMMIEQIPNPTKQSFSNVCHIKDPVMHGPKFWDLDRYVGPSVKNRNN